MNGNTSTRQVAMSSTDSHYPHLRRPRGLDSGQRVLKYNTIRRRDLQDIRNSQINLGMWLRVHNLVSVYHGLEVGPKPRSIQYQLYIGRLCVAGNSHWRCAVLLQEIPDAGYEH